VATFGVVVVLADLADEDVVTGCGLGRVVEERRPVIALQQVLTGATLDPVVAVVAEHCVSTLTGVDEVGAWACEGLVVVGSAEDHVLAVATHEDVVAGTTLDDVGPVEIGLDVVAFATEYHVVAAVAFDDVVAGATPEGVVVVTTEHPVVAARACVGGVGAVVD